MTYSSNSSEDDSMILHSGDLSQGSSPSAALTTSHRSSMEAIRQSQLVQDEEQPPEEQEFEDLEAFQIMENQPGAFAIGRQSVTHRVKSSVRGSSVELNAVLTASQLHAGMNAVLSEDEFQQSLSSLNNSNHNPVAAVDGMTVMESSVQSSTRRPATRASQVVAVDDDLQQNAIPEPKMRFFQRHKCHILSGLFSKTSTIHHIIYVIGCYL